MGKDHGDDYQKYLLERHEAFITPSSVIGSILQKVTTSKPISQDRLILGEINEVYSIATEDGTSVILRISREENPRFKQEKWALDQVRLKEVPTPRVLLVDTAQVVDREIAVCVEEKLPGVALDKLRESESKGVDWVKDIVIKAGEILQKIHSVPVKGFGYLNDSGVGEYQTWEEFMLADKQKQEKLKEIAQRESLDPDIIDRAFQVLEEGSSIYKNIEPRLLHSDFTPKHILVENDDITGIVDMENCQGGDIARDFAWWDFFRSETYPVEWLMEGYGDTEVKSDDFKKRMKLCRIQIALSLLDWYDFSQNPGGLKYVINKLKIEMYH